MGAGRHGVGLACLLLAGSAAGADQASLRTDVTRAGPAVEVHASIDASASRELCYSVLADFDHLAEFIPGMVSSRIVSEPGSPLLLRQVGRTSFGIADRDVDVTLSVQVDPPRQIDFERVAGNLKQMRGQWRVAGSATTCTIRYEALIEPEFWVPPVIGPLLVRQQVARQIDGLAAEIARRAGH